MEFIDFLRIETCKKILWKIRSKDPLNQENQIFNLQIAIQVSQNQIHVLEMRVRVRILKNGVPEFTLVIPVWLQKAVNGTGLKFQIVVKWNNNNNENLLLPTVA